MKIALLIGDGMGDYPLDKLGHKTPLQVAMIPNMRRVAAAGITRLVTTIPEGMTPGSDVANLSIMGFDPRMYYSGRAPIEAAGIGLKLAADEVAFRCNLVTIEAELIKDHSADHITTPEAQQLVAELGRQLGRAGLRFVVGTSYRHLLIWKNGPADLITTPPHDVLGQPANRHAPQGSRRDEAIQLMEASKLILAKHPVNLARRQAGKNMATQIWLWGQGRCTALPAYEKLFGLTGGVISAVDLVRGIGRLAGLETPLVPGATGFIDTNYQGKVQAALDILKRKNFVLIHVEAPDECGHMGDPLKKIGAIEAFDQQVVGPMLQGLQALGCPYRLIIGTDHRTPVSVRNHTRDPVPMVVMEGPLKMALAEKPFDESVDAGKSHELVFEWLKTVLSQR